MLVVFCSQVCSSSTARQKCQCQRQHHPKALLSFQNTANCIPLFHASFCYSPILLPYSIIAWGKIGCLRDWFPSLCGGLAWHVWAAVVVCNAGSDETNLGRFCFYRSPLRRQSSNGGYATKRNRGIECLYKSFVNAQNMI